VRTAPFLVMLSPGIRLAGAALGLATAPSLIARMHGERAGYADPTKGGLGGTLGYAAFGGPLAAIAYGQGHAAGREKAKNKGIENLQQLAALGAASLVPGANTQMSFSTPEQAAYAQQLIQNPQMINPYATQIFLQ